MEGIEALEAQLLALEAKAGTDSNESAARLEIHRRLAELYEAQADFAQALRHYKQYHHLEKQAPTFVPSLALPPEGAHHADRRRLADALRRSRVKTRELYQVSRSLNTAHSEETLLEVLAQPALERGAFWATLAYLPQDEHNDPEQLELAAVITTNAKVGSEGPTHLPFPPFTRLWTTSSGRPQLIRDIRSDDRIEARIKQLYQEWRVQAAAILPLTHAGRGVGLLAFYWEQPHQFNEDERGIYTTLVGLAAPAVHSRRMLVKLEESEERLREVVEGTSDLVAQIDLEGRFIYLNHAAEQVLGQPAENCLGLSLFDFVHSEDRDQTKKRFTDWLETLSFYVAFENRLVNSQTGQVYPLVWSVNLHRDAANRLTHFSAIAHDITIRKEAEEAVRRVNAELRQRIEELATLNRITQTLATLTSLPVALEFVAWELVAVLSGTGAVVGLLDSTRSTLKIVAHYSQTGTENLVGQAYPLSIHPLSARVVAAGRAVVITDAQNNPLLGSGLEMVRARGIHALVGLPLLARGEIIGQVIISSTTPGRTFTPDEIKLAETIAGQVAGAIANAQLFEEEKQQRQIAESMREAAEVANQAKSTFLTTVSHEFRTPLNGILGYAQLLKQKPALTEEEQEGLEVIEQSGEHLLMLINDILDLSKIEAGRLELVSLDFHLPTFLRKVGGMIRALTQHEGLAFRLRVKALPEYVHADERRLRQVLFNLLSNAVKFTNEGSVTLRVTGFPALPSTADRLVRFEVEDTGSGIAPEQLEHIFVPFQKSRDYARKIQGTGLGLAICHDLVELMGGTLQVKSTPGQGSLFWFELRLPEVQLGDSGQAPEFSETSTLTTWPDGEELASREGRRQPTPPPPSELMRLGELARIGDVASIRHYAAQLKAQNGELKPFAVELERLVRSFRLEALQGWLKSYDTTAENEDKR